MWSETWSVTWRGTKALGSGPASLVHNSPIRRPRSASRWRTCPPKWIQRGGRSMGTSSIRLEPESSASDRGSPSRAPGLPGPPCGRRQDHGPERLGLQPPRNRACQPRQQPTLGRASRKRACRTPGGRSGSGIRLPGSMRSKAVRNGERPPSGAIAGIVAILGLHERGSDRRGSIAMHSSAIALHAAGHPRGGGARAWRACHRCSL